MSRCTKILPRAFSSQPARGGPGAAQHRQRPGRPLCCPAGGQYFPSAYAPLDFQYQTTWNDQVGGPDYAYQWLFVSGPAGDGPRRQAHLDQQLRWDLPCMTARSYPGKLARVAAHDLAFGGSGIGFACEGFSNLLGGMNYGQSKAGRISRVKPARRTCARVATSSTVSPPWRRWAAAITAWASSFQKRSLYLRRQIHCHGLRGAAVQGARRPHPPGLHAALRHRGGVGRGEIGRDQREGAAGGGRADGCR